MAEPTSKSVISSSEVAFPRGGATALTPLEVKEISNEATKDVLFEASKTAKRSGSSKSEQPAKKSRRAPKKKVAQEEGQETNNVQIENFNFKNLIPGTFVLGQITNIGKLDITLAIGDNLVGYIPITSVSEELTTQIEKYEQESEESEEDEEQELAYDDQDKDTEIRTGTLKTKETAEFPDLKSLFSVGEWLRAKVVTPSDNKKRRIQLTVEPETVNEPLEDEDLTSGNVLQCSIKSVEDHGIILNTGKEGLSGFISNKEIKNAEGLEVENLRPGKVILASIITKASTRSITLRPVQTSSKKAAITSISSVDAILPGILVDALVADVTKNGLIVKVFGLVDATINLAQLQEFDLKALQHKYTIGNTIKARIMAVLLKAGSKKLILSHLPHIISYSSNANSNDALEAFPVGHILENTEIVGSDPNYLFVKFGSSLLGQVHNSKIDKEKTLELDYNIGSKHKARVVGYNNVDNLLVLSLDPKVVESQYLHASDIPNGTALKSCEILKVLPDAGGIILKVLDEFEGFVPGSHMSDIKLVYPERKFKVGAKVKGRLLSKNGNKLVVTLKKSLVNVEDDEILASFDKATIGFKTPATVEKFVHNGAIVSFFGNLKAYLPKNEISETFVNNASDYLKLGQSVNVRIMDIKEQEKRLLVTLRQSTELSSTQKSTINDLQPGKSIVTASVVDKTKDSIIVELEETNLRGVIFTGHLSDGNYEQNRALAKRLPISDKLEVLVLEKDLKARTVIVSAKKSLIDAAKQDSIPAYFKDIKVDDKMLRGFVKSVTNKGLFVSFAGKLTGLVLAKYATDNANEDLLKKFYKYQSLACRVISVDEDNKRFLLSLKDTNGSNSLDTEAVVNPVDSSKKIIGEYTPGVITKAIIKSVKGTQLNVQLADNLQGRVDISQCFNSWNEIKDKKQPLSQFHKGEVIDAKIIGFHDAKNHKFLPITHRKSNKNIILELSLLESEIKSSKDYQQLSLSNIAPSSQYIAYVNNIAKGYVWASLSPNIRGRISFMELTDNVSIFDDLENNLPIGSAIQATVKEVDNEHHTVLLSARTNVVSSFTDVKVGQKYPARILKVKDTYVLVELGDNVVASAFITDALDNYSDKLENVFHANEFATATVLEIDSDSKKIAVSLRSDKPVDKVINTFEDLNRGDVVKGFVKNIANNGVYVSLGRSVHALVRVADLSDSYLKDWKKYFKPHQQILGKVSACKEEGRVLLTLKESEVSGELNVLKRFEDLEVGQIFEGSVKRATDFGVFIKLDGTLNITGLCHHSQIADNDVQNVTALFGEGDRVKVKLLAIDQEKKQLSLGMKASYFTTETDVENDDEDIEMNEASEADSEDSEDEEDEEQEDEDDVENNDDDDEVMEDAFTNAASDDDSESEEEEASEKKTSGLSGLSTNGFDWTASILDQAEDDESSSDEEDFTQDKKKKKRSQAVVDKTADLNTRAPQSVSDFERLLVGNPSSSILWMNYMSFQLQLSEIDKAREIGERALKTINYREEQEKMNIWIALLNLENSFGSDESLDETFKRSTQYMDSLTMHQKLVSIYCMSEKFEKAEELYKVMSKKFGKSVSVWVQYGSFLLDRQLQDETHEVLARALQILPKRDHIEVVRKFAQLEFSKGDAEQARSLFEGLVADAPKRIDLWNVYVDQEIKQDNKSKVEDIFERVLSKKLSRKQAKFFFNKWLAYEEEKGDEQMAARVKSRAAEYVQSQNKEA
ncbi:uncharacterized protein RJT20DRAFT_125982 [Scheffersomyces xylosifermentans]|uniref:uncharacterized protein n=1 Tax=Scheffersomyces xylosifermentans TaxID=1304137 RepID=UPI00315CFCB2